MFCPKCGAQNPDGALFCAGCGASLSFNSAAPANDAAPQSPDENSYQAPQQPQYQAPGEAPQQPRYQPPRKSNKKAIIISVVAAVVLIAVLTTVLVVVLGGGYKSVVKKFMSITTDGNCEALMDIVPDKALDSILEDVDMSRSELKESLKKMSDQYKEMLKEAEKASGKKLRITYKITDTEDIEGDDLDSLTEEIKDGHNTEISAAMKVNVVLTYSAGEDSDSEDGVVPLVKVDGKWYLSPDEADEMIRDLRYY